MTATPHILRTGEHGAAEEFGRALKDVALSIRRMGVAWALARNDIAARYRGSLLGPFWITLSMGVVVLGTGTLYSQLFKLDSDILLPYVAVGLVVWTFLSSTIIDGCDTLISAGSILRQSAMPLFLFVWRTVLRNLVTLAHHAVIIVAVLAYTGRLPADVPLAIAGLLALVMICTPTAMTVAIVSARFRDVPQIIQAVVQFMMFMTPIFWMAHQVGRNHHFLTWNPFYYYIDAVRSPILGSNLDPRTWGVLAVSIIVTWTVAIVALTATRRRIVHYL